MNRTFTAWGHTTLLACFLAYSRRSDVQLEPKTSDSLRMFPGGFTGRPSASSGAAAMDAVQASSAAARHQARHGGDNAQVAPALDIAALMLRRAVEPHPSTPHHRILRHSYCGGLIAAVLWRWWAVAALVPPPPLTGLGHEVVDRVGRHRAPVLDTHLFRTRSESDYPSSRIFHHARGVTEPPYWTRTCACPAVAAVAAARHKARQGCR